MNLSRDSETLIVQFMQEIAEYRQSVLTALDADTYMPSLLPSVRWLIMQLEESIIKDCKKALADEHKAAQDER